ncbi:MAG: hypothetical protein NC483_02510, partial [Ruminococcus sp.]|nr:hypothetical protein [Ruminococcus sp.]
FSGVSKSDKCYLYFDKIDGDKPTTMKELLQNYYINKKTRLDGTFNEVIEEETKNTIYVDFDDYDKTYYFAGNPLDNWFLFGGYYWRIIRVNGDGSIRLIYHGKEVDGPQKTGKVLDVVSKFSANFDNNKYVGYWYDEEIGSTIYNILNNWYIETSGLQEYQQYIDINAGFCNDRIPSSNELSIDNIGGVDKMITYYGAYIRLTSNGTSSNLSKPTFKCNNINKDLFTYKESVQGNKLLENPVGLITADEANYAGLAYGNKNNNNFLLTDGLYWTITPYRFENIAMQFIISSNALGYWNVNAGNAGIKPVINLRSDVKFTGDGTQFNPYKVVV